MSTGYGVVVIPLSNAPAELRLLGKPFVPGMWLHRHELHPNAEANLFESLRSTLPPPLSFVFEERFRSHLVPESAQTIGKNAILAIERIQSKDDFSLDILVLHLHVELKTKTVFNKIARLRKEGIQILQESIGLASNLIAANHRAFCVVGVETTTQKNDVSQGYEDNFITFLQAGFEDNYDRAITFGSETVILAALQHYSAQYVFQNLPLEVEDYTKPRNISLLKLFNDKYWMNQIFFPTSSAGNLLIALREFHATELFASILLKLYETNLEYSRNKKLDRLNLSFILLGALGVIISIYSLFRNIGS